jgi:hypothetical protein
VLKILALDDYNTSTEQLILTEFEEEKVLALFVG